MTTSDSPRWRLKQQANKIAAALKAAERGEKIAVDPAGKIAASSLRESVVFGVVMDDKIIKVEMPWVLIRETSEAGISEWIIQYMRGKQNTKQ